MTLELEITSYHRLSPTVQVKKTVTQPAFLIGRSAQCDWHLPDPERIVSSNHAQLENRNDNFFLRDLSTNGVFVNDADQALGKNNEVQLAHGDRLRIGDYEIRVKRHHESASLKLPTVNAGLPTEQSDIAVLSQARPTDINSEPAPAALASAIHPSSTATGAISVDLPPNLIPNDLIPNDTVEDALALPSSLPSSLPDDWGWQEAIDNTTAGKPDQDDRIDALLAALGIQDLFNREQPDARFMRETGLLLRSLLDHVITLLHERAAQKQLARVQQTTFNRSENNPLKFATGSRDALETLLIRKQSSYLNAETAIRGAFNDINNHDQSVIKGLQAIIHECLTLPAQAATSPHGWRFNASRQQLRHIEALSQQKLHEYSDINRIYRSSIFADAYETEREYKE